MVVQLITAKRSAVFLRMNASVINPDIHPMSKYKAIMTGATKLYVPLKSKYTSSSCRFVIHMLLSMQTIIDVFSEIKAELNPITAKLG